MSEQEILTQAIEKAMAGGWQGFSYETDIKGNNWMTGPAAEDLVKAKYYPDTHELVINLGENITVDLNKLIFDHDFAKALWGNEEHDAWLDEDSGAYPCEHCHGEYVGIIGFCWEYHLQQMVIDKNPIEYLGETLI